MSKRTREGVLDLRGARIQGEYVPLAQLEAAERKLEEEREWFRATQASLMEANAKLAELIAEVRAYQTGENRQRLSDILEKYEDKP